MVQAYFTHAKPQPEPHLPPGWHVKAFLTLDSTSNALRRLVEQGADVAEGLLIWAETQTAGRGRAGRAWTSPPGNVYASFLIAAPAPAATPELGLLAGVAAAEAILDLPRHNAAPPRVSCKWPNDVLVEGAKVAGILPELVTGADGRSWVILGIGVNLVPVELAQPLYPVTALSSHHIETTPGHVLTVLSRALAGWLARWREEGFRAVREAWLALGPAQGTPVSVNLGLTADHERLHGTFAGLDADGALLLRTPEGERRILAGDVLAGAR